MADKSATGANFSYDLFFRGPEGFGEHFQVVAETADDLLKGRTPLINALQIMDAKPLPRDMDNQGRSYPKGSGASAQSGPSPAPGTVPVCPLDGAPMQLRQPKDGQTWPAFWSCSNYNRGACCKGKRNA